MAKTGIKSGVLLPALRCFITGIFAFILAWIIGVYRGWSSPWLIGGLVGSAAALLSWLIAIRMTSSKSDPGFKPSKVYPTTTRVEITASDPAGAFSAGRWADLKVTPGSLTAVARRIEAGASFSHAGLAGPGRPLSRSEYEVLRDEFISRGLAYWINPSSHSQGVKLSRAGVAVMRHFAEKVTVPLPSLPQLPTYYDSTVTIAGAAHARRNTRKEGLLSINPD